MVTEQVAQNKHGILIIGIGNAYRGDDAVGLHVAQCLKKQAHDHVHVIEESGEGASLMECWKDANSVILIDAVSSGAKPGTIHRLDAHTQPIPTNFFITPHTPSVLPKPSSFQGRSIRCLVASLSMVLRGNALRRVLNYLLKSKRRHRKLQDVYNKISRILEFKTYARIFSRERPDT